MTREEKSQVIDELVDKFKSNSNFYFTDASGLTVASINKFREICFNKGIKYGVYKNTLINKALDQLDTDYSDFSSEVLKGFTGIIFSKEIGNLPAKVIKEFRKSLKIDKPLLKGASINTDLFIGEDQLDRLASLKSREELIGEILLLLQSPIQTVLGQLRSGQDKLSGIVETLSEREN
jgi:large subunit ribosomal protein L10